MKQGQHLQPREKQGEEQRPFTFTSQHLIGLLLLVALIAFEMFNFDTTKYALSDFFGKTSFAGLQWATILAIAFCAIDFAGLIRFFTPEESQQTPTEIWYLMGAWMLAATLNALMTWWAINLTLLNHDLGNEIMNREELLRTVPLFVAALVWLTRLLFIGAFSVAGGYIFNWRQPPAQPLMAPAPRQTKHQQTAKMEETTDAFHSERRPLPHQLQRTPTAVYARSRKK